PYDRTNQNGIPKINNKTVMDLRDVFENIATENNWKLVYARRDYQNLTDVTDMIYSASKSLETGETFLFVDPIIRRPNEFGTTYSGNFMILTNSDLDDVSYEAKFEKYIRPLLYDLRVRFHTKLLCDYDILQWRI